VKKAMNDPALTKKLDEVGLAPGYRDPKDFAAFWNRTEVSTMQLVQLAKQRQD
jgi:tripartite-type tricarboxylate transporter receptor subunit TctC